MGIETRKRLKIPTALTPRYQAMLQRIEKSTKNHDSDLLLTEARHKSQENKGEKFRQFFVRPRQVSRPAMLLSPEPATNNVLAYHDDARYERTIEKSGG